jgi:hypothetical protein
MSRTPPPDASGTAADAFIRRWTARGGAERANYGVIGVVGLGYIGSRRLSATFYAAYLSEAPLARCFSTRQFPSVRLVSK